MKKLSIIVIAALLVTSAVLAQGLPSVYASEYLSEGAYGAVSNTPADISLSATTVHQSAGTNAVVGTLMTTDADAGDTHTYMLVSGTGSTHNGLFNIAGNQLRANDASQLAAGSYSVSIRTTDTGDLFYDEVFTITVLDDIAPSFVNGTPSLVNTTKTEATLLVRLNEAGKVYYVVLADDAAAPTVAQVKAGLDNQNVPARYSGIRFVDIANSNMNWKISGLTPGTAYDVYVVAEDNASVPNTQNAVIKLDVSTAANQAPTAISLDHMTVNQSAGTNAVVGTLMTTDADAGDTHTYMLVSGTGSTHNALFNIAGNQLRANDASQLAAGSYSVSIRTTDTGDLFFDEVFTITVVDDIAPSFTNGTPILSNTTKTGTTLTVQLNEAGTVYYAMVADGAAAPSVAQVQAGNNAQDDSALRSGSIIVSAANTDGTSALVALAANTAYDIYVVAEDQAAVPNMQSTVTKLDFATVGNQVPTGISLSHTTVNKNAGVNAVVGALMTTDADAGDTHTYMLVSGTGSTNNALFNIAGNQLRANNASQLAAGTYSVRIRTTDNNGGTFENVFVLTVAGDAAPHTPGIETPADHTATTGSQTSPQPVGQGKIRPFSLAVDGTNHIEQVNMVRKVNSEGKSEDVIVLDLAQMRNIVEKALEQGRTIVSLLIDDLPDEPADEVKVTIKHPSVQLLSSNNIALKINTDYAAIHLSEQTLQMVEQQDNDLYFRIAPIRDNGERQQAAERMITANQVQAAAGEDKVGIVGKSTIIETNYSKSDTQVVLPLQGIELPNNPAQLQRLLNSLAVYIEHSDGEKKIQYGDIVFDANGRPLGIEIEVSKFSTFTVFSFSDTDVSSPYVSGYANGAFMPDRPVARAELAAMLSRLLTERLQDAEATTAYKDVDASHWAVQHISAMRPLGLMAGYPDSTFRPDQPVTRAEFAHAIVRLLTDKQATPAYLVNDIEGHWAQDSITRILAAKMMNGYPDGTFRPNSLLTRAEAVSTLNRLFGRLPLQGATSQYIDVPRSHWAYGDIMEASVERPLSSQVE